MYLRPENKLEPKVINPKKYVFLKNSFRGALINEFPEITI